MSVRAYRIIKIERAEDSSFNLWHDTELLEELLDSEGALDQRNNDGGGFIEVSVDGLKSVLKNKKLKLEKYIKDALKADIAFAKKKRDDYILYECF